MTRSRIQAGTCLGGVSSMQIQSPWIAPALVTSDCKSTNCHRHALQISAGDAGAVRRGGQATLAGSLSAPTLPVQSVAWKGVECILDDFLIRDGSVWREVLYFCAGAAFEHSAFAADCLAAAALRRHHRRHRRR